MGIQVPPLLRVAIETRVSLKRSKNGRYHYAYIRIPASIKALVEGRYFHVERKGNILIYRISEASSNAFKPVKYGNSLYIRLPLDAVSSSKAIIELLPDGFLVRLA